MTDSQPPIQTGSGVSKASPGPLFVGPDTWQSIERYVCAKIELERGGGASRSQLEEARSYAVEAISALFQDNPTLCAFRRRMDAVLNARNKR